MFKLFSIEDEYRHWLVSLFGLKLRFRKKGYKNFTVPKELCNIPVLYDADANECVYNKLKENKPCMITRFGSVEITTIGCYLDYKDKSGNCKFPQKIINDMIYQTGFFSANNEQLVKFCNDTLDFIKNIDILGVWQYTVPTGVSEERVLQNRKSDNIQLVHFGYLANDLLYIDNPWTRVLEGKKVLVIHPFVKTIEKQYQKRHLLFKNNLLPDFELITLKAIQGIDTQKATEDYGNWFNALQTMCNEIDKLDFDVALIGAGSFGMFLANHVKQTGKQAVHLGGFLQILFGITGERWEQDEKFMQIKNEHWTRPSEDECVTNLTNFLKGEKNKAYW